MCVGVTVLSVLSPLCLFNPLVLNESCAIQKLPEAPADGGQQEDEGPE